MPKKQKKLEETGQLNLFDNTTEIDDKDLDFEFEDIDLESLSGEDLGISESVSDRRVETVRQLLTLKLLREAIRAENPDDRVMADFAEMVLPNLLRLAIGSTAKGGNFIEAVDRGRELRNKPKAKRDNAGDQSHRKTTRKTQYYRSTGSKGMRAQVGDRWVYSPRFREIPLLAFSRDAGEIYRD